VEERKISFRDLDKALTQAVLKSLGKNGRRAQESCPGPGITAMTASCGSLRGDEGVNNVALQATLDALEEEDLDGVDADDSDKLERLLGRQQAQEEDDAELKESFKEGVLSYVRQKAKDAQPRREQEEKADGPTGDSHQQHETVKDREDDRLEEGDARPKEVDFEVVLEKCRRRCKDREKKEETKQEEDLRRLREAAEEQFGGEEVNTEQRRREQHEHETKPRPRPRPRRPQSRGELRNVLYYNSHHLLAVPMKGTLLLEKGKLHFQSNKQGMYRGADMGCYFAWKLENIEVKKFRGRVYSGLKVNVERRVTNFEASLLKGDDHDPVSVEEHVFTRVDWRSVQMIWTAIEEAKKQWADG